MAGKITLNGVDVKTYLPSRIRTTDDRTCERNLNEHVPTFSSGTTYYYPTEWMHDAFEGHVEHNDEPLTIAPQGTRPVKDAVNGTTFVGTTKYLNNVDGKLYLSDSANSATGWSLLTSKERQKICVINCLFYAAGGKGGGGAYWFLAGNWGGVGGGGAAQALYTFVIENKKYLKIVTDSDTDKTGRLNNSSDETFKAPDLRIYTSSGSLVCTVGGGYSGTSHHPRWHQDDYARSTFSYTSARYVANGVQFLLQRYGQGTYKRYNGNNGYDSFLDYSGVSPYWGNPEGVEITSYRNSGGTGAGESQGHGSGGGASHSSGGAGGDTGNGSDGGYGQSGAGGGGSGSPAGGANGGDGTPCGLVFYY